MVFKTPLHASRVLLRVQGDHINPGMPFDTGELPAFTLLDRFERGYDAFYEPLRR